MLREWGSGPYEDWFNHVYQLSRSNEQFLWNKIFINDWLFGQSPHPQAMEMWASGQSVKFGLDGRRFLGILALCNLDGRNLSAEMKVLIDPGTVPTHNEIKTTVNEALNYAFSNGLERVYCYVPCTGSKVFRYWERMMEKVMRRIGHEKHAIRTSKRWIGRTLFEAVKE